MLTTEQKKILVEKRLLEYDARLFSLEMDLSAATAADDKIGVKDIQRNIEALTKARSAVEGMMIHANTTDTTS
jgi:hypothetical protein